MNTFGKITTLIVIVFLMVTAISGSINVSSNIQLTYTRNGTQNSGLTILNVSLLNSSIQTMLLDDVNNRLYVGTQMGVNIIELDNLSVTNITWNDGLVGNNTHEIEIDYGRNQFRFHEY